MVKTNEVQKHSLEPLFELELQYREGMEAVTSPQGRLGEYLGSGDGTVKGPNIQGTVDRGKVPVYCLLTTVY